MKMLLEYHFQPTDPWPPYLCGPIQIHGGHIYYPYCDSLRIYCRKIALDGTVEVLSIDASDGMGLPKQWLWFWQDGHLMLGCREHCLDLESGLLLTDIPFQPPPLLDETKEARLSDCILRCKNSRVYQCFDFHGNLLWEEKHKGYRYTPFEERKDCVIFGTAGHGGGLYCYRRADGECLCSVDTKGTPHYVWCGESIVTRGREGELLLVDPFHGSVVRSVSLRARFNDYSRFCADGTTLCAVGFEPKTNHPHIYLFDLEGFCEPKASFDRGCLPRSPHPAGAPFRSG